MLTHERCRAIAGAEIEAFAATIADADPETPVPTCGRWRMRQLVHHTGVIHRWVAAIVRTRSQTRLSRKLADHPLPPTAAGQAEWLRAGGADLAAAWTGADPAEPVWTWGPGKSVGWWSRRMVHETGVHHADALLALGATPAWPVEVAADGVGEFLANLPSAARWAEGVRELHGTGSRLLFAATDAPGRWLVTLEPKGFTVTEDVAGDGAVDVRAEGPAADLYLAVWGRLPASSLSVTGNTALLEYWMASTAI
jgi:uncharacterized protein (TIGR03083 family)